ncbi:glutaredoxin domain-containing cysteine-rich protein 2 [Oxyura jamaicensis]|uniref:glutaredoxin domain-containing cysteine-rich protein 2 n=1 Tax=Oxyura jamaicensis TaxID=8884 RepID=UPI0015A5C8B9|nr:glutaredoxin domain-containing cysteine-rich protein 2 [Oxyura jamaicensis]XP_035194528.1 glutaredoxin domain-containing cysteine-rich protein 2 [Oxyura jamaicensis]XP_035194529.1 glutaredoxin domain-containing cysteine-rich protein 2 [Oxyura jamaicensis]XP_035194530.1 glutaredoxin domain-containing cysteine-rich protein 2 [Oxyura jamaicensis]
MDEHQKKLNQRHEGRPRKVRFKISSAYSGRVLKQVYEDGQELEPPAKEQSRRFLRHSFEPGNRPCAAGDAAEGRLCPPAKLSAQRISIFKEDKTYSLASTSPLFSDCPSSDGRCRASPVIDFGKIIIYTNNLKIIRAPMDQKELMRRIIQTEGVNDWAFIYQGRKDRIGTGHKKEVEKKAACNQYMQGGDAEHTCSQCKGSGSAPCSLCHGSKFSMLANRFRESYRALRCPACNESGLQPCQICAA